MRNARLKHTILIWLCLLCANALQAQMIPVQHPRNGALRYEIDAKRMGVELTSDDALPRSREFKRIDSSYYVGWMFEGAYKYEHAADYLGNKNAAASLERAIQLLSRDYRRELSTRTSAPMTYFPVYRFHEDYSRIGYMLMNCYSNMEEPEKVMAMLQAAKKWNFQFQFGFEPYNYLGWTVHRNRFYTSAKYPFLRDSIAANEQLAHAYLDSCLRQINRNWQLNSAFLPDMYHESERLSVYHYKSILHSYALHIDSASYYYEKMRNTAVFPHNNYATFRMICGDFREAESEYELAIAQDGGDKRLKEWAYYTALLDIYKGMPKTGTALMKDMIKANGSTPGFGWYNIALARTLLYDGQIEEANRYANKAAEFKELHIGTTLGQTHYDFSVQLLKLLAKQDQWYMQKFEHRNWWYNLPVLGRMLTLTGERYMQQFLIINQLAQNPERDRVIYKLFSTESTVGWDETWFLIKDFSTNYFLDRFQKQAENDGRKYIKKYFNLYVARLKMEQGKHEEARQMLDAILRDPNMDAEYEKLFLARVFQAQAACAKELDRNDDYHTWMDRTFQIYPQLMPFSGMQMNMRLQVSGAADEAVMERLKDCNINWMADGSVPAPTVYLTFSGSGAKKTVSYYVMNSNGEYAVTKQGLNYTKPEVAAVELAYRIFNIGGKVPEEEAPEENDRGRAL